jgi:hypothetical protein
MSGKPRSDAAKKLDWAEKKLEAAGSTSRPNWSPAMPRR